MTDIGPATEFPPGTVKAAGEYVVGNHDGEYFAVTRRCRHLGADLAKGSVDDDGCLVCPWHGARYDVATGRMVDGPQGVFKRVPGLGATFKAITKALPLGRAKVEVKDGNLHLDDGR